MAKPATVVDLQWQRALVFQGTSGAREMALDGNSAEAPSPVQAMAFAMAGCMSTDVVHLLTKGRHPLTGLRVHMVADRAQDDPHRFVKVRLQFTVQGEVPDDAIDRAIELSRDKYCSVWHSMRQDIELSIAWGRA